MSNDLLTDILQRLAELPQVELEPQKVRRLESELRRDWGGETYYVAKVGECGRARLSERDARICAEHRRGERVELLSRRWGLSIRRVQQIVRGLESAVEVAVAITTAPSVPANDAEPPRRRRRRSVRNDLP